MRRWGWILVVALLAVLGAATWALRNVDRLANENRGRVAARLERVLGRPVSFGDVGVSLWGGPAVRVSNVEIADDPAYSEEPFARASAVRIEVSLRAALFGRLEIREVVVERPALRIIRTAEGLNLDSIGAARARAVAGSESRPVRAGGASLESRASMAVVVALASVRNGSIEWIDRTVTPPRRAFLHRIDVEATGAGTVDPLSVEIAAATTATGDPNVRLWGEVGPLPIGAERPADDVPIDLSLRIGPLAPAEIGDVLPPDLGAPDSVTITGDLRGTPRQLEFALSLEAKGARLRVGEGGEEVRGPGFSADVRGRTSSERLEIVSLEVVGPALEASASGTLHLGSPRRGALRVDASGTLAEIAFEDLSASIEIDDEEVTLRPSRARAFGGTVAAEGGIDFGEEPPAFELRSRLSGLDVEQLLASRVPEAKGRLAGRLSGRMTVSGAGTEREAILDSLRGAGRLEVEDGAILGANLPDAILEGITGVRGLTSLVSDGFRNRWAGLLTAEDTSFDELLLPIEIANRRVTTADATASARDYELRADGFVDFEGTLDLDATFVASERLTEDLFSRAREMRSLADADGRLAIPARIVGSLGEVRVVPDAAFVRRVLARGAAELGRQLLGSDGDADEAPPGDDEPADPSSPLERGVEWLRDLLAR